MHHHPPEPCVVHPLPAAPHFVGRAAELDALRSCWQSGWRGVMAIVGLGGAGKTAVASRFVADLLETTAAPRADGLFIWSFYQQPDAALFLQEAYGYFCRNFATHTGARGSGILHLLHDALAVGGPHLLVLDGLERVQRHEGSGAYGQIDDPLLKGLLLRIAEGVGRTTVLVTSRFPLADLMTGRAPGYRSFDLGGLDPEAARALLRRRGVSGDDVALTALVDVYGAHALTLDHLGGIIGQFLSGDPRRAPEVSSVAGPGTDRQALRLARLLRAYEEHLPPAELALLCRLCLLRRSVTEEQLAQLFLCFPAVHARTIRELHVAIAHMPAPIEGAQVDLADYAQAVSACLEELLCAAPIGGPEELFRREILAAVAQALELQCGDSDADFAALAREYAAASPDVQDDARPLALDDRAALRELCARYLELRRHPLMPFKPQPHAELEQALAALYSTSPERRAGDLRPDDLLHAYKMVTRRLWHLTCKHFILRRVRELAVLHQRKHALAGPLASCDADGLHDVLAGLIGRHLVVREADGSFSIHPAVRDYFHRLAVATQDSGWHDLLREQMVSLVQQPGVRLPEDAATLDLVEEAIYHALVAGRTDEAHWLYRDVLGGMRHLAWKLGETARGLRILRGFDPCPDRDALAWFLRALGEYDEAYAISPMPYFRADIRLLQGRLPEVAREAESARTTAAAFLMGESRALPPDLLGCAVPRDQLLLYLGRLGVVRHTAALAGLYEDIGRAGEQARHRLLQAEVARRQSDLDACRTHLAAVSRWILHSGSVEHLCLMHLTEARAHRDSGDLGSARRALDAGLHLARRCGLRLHHVELLCTQAVLHLRDGDPAAAEAAARDAMQQALAPVCRFLWGGAAAGHVLGETLAARGDRGAAAAALHEALELRRRLGDPLAAQTERLLKQLCERPGRADGL